MRLCVCASVSMCVYLADRLHLVRELSSQHDNDSQLVAGVATLCGLYSQDASGGLG